MNGYPIPRRIREQQAQAPRPVQWDYVVCGDLAVSTAKLEEATRAELAHHNTHRTAENLLQGLDGFILWLVRSGYVDESQRELARTIVTPIWQNWPL